MDQQRANRELDKLARLQASFSSEAEPSLRALGDVDCEIERRMIKRAVMLSRVLWFGCGFFTGCFGCLAGVGLCAIQETRGQLCIVGAVFCLLLAAMWARMALDEARES